MGFDAATAIAEPLDYKGLSEWGIADGTVPEPTAQALVRFVEVLQELENIEGTPEAGVGAAEVMQRAQAATAELCGGTPTAEQFAALPVRLFMAFVKWLAGELLGPKA